MGPRGRRTLAAAALVTMLAATGEVNDVRAAGEDPGARPPGAVSPGAQAPSQPPQAQSPPQAPPAALLPPRRRRLSDERRLSRYAYVSRATWARARPTQRSRRVKRLRPVTSDRTAELVLLLEDLGVEGDAGWVRVRLPIRPAGRTGWVRRAHLGEYRAVRTALRIDRRRRRATLFRDGRSVWRAPIGVGRPGSPTPAGRFYIRERLVPRRGTLYGVLAFGTSAYSAQLTDWPGGGVIGIHGTDEPQLIPGAVSHGCVRLHNRSIARLDRLMPLGTPVRIR